MKDIHVHVEYSNSTFINDIAVIVLLKNVEFSSTSVMPVCMDWTGDYSNIPINTDGQVIIIMRNKLDSFTVSVQ